MNGFLRIGRFICLVIMLFGLVACGGGGGGSDNSSTTSTTTSSGGSSGGGGGSSGGGGLGPTDNPSGMSYASPIDQMLLVARASYMVTDGVGDSGITYLDFTAWLLPQLYANGEIENTPCMGACAPGHDDYQNRVDFACPNAGSASVWHWEDNDSSTTLTAGDDYLVVIAGSCSFTDSDGDNRTVTLDASDIPEGRGTLNIVSAASSDVEYIINGSYIDNGASATVTRDPDPLTTYRLRRSDDASERVEISEYNIDFANRDRLSMAGRVAANTIGDAFAFLPGGTSFVVTYNNVSFSLVGGEPQMVSGSIVVTSSLTADFTVSVSADPAFVTITHAGGAGEVAQEDIFIPLRPH